MEAKKVCFIINPISGTGKQKKIEAIIKKKLHPFLEYSFEYTQAPGHAIELSKKAAEEGYNIIVAVGGDGSVNEVSKGLYGSKVALAIVPTGSGNGLARHLTIPLVADKAIHLLHTGKVAAIDVIIINETIALNMVGIGFDAHIAWKFSTSPKRGFRSYIKTIWQEFFTYKPHEYTLYVNKEKFIKKAFLITFANGAQYGNNAVISPQSTINDGYMEICMLKKFPLSTLPSIVYKLFTGKMHTSTYIEYIKTKEAIIEQHSNLAHIDGEPLCIGNKLHIKINPVSLNVIVPRTYPHG